MVENINMPASSGGLVRYFDEYKSKIQIKPEYIIIFLVVIIFLEIILRVIY